MGRTGDRRGNLIVCGRYVTPEQTEIERYWKVKGRNIAEPMRARYNAAPTQMMPIIRGGDSRELVAMKWGLIPPWAKDPKEGARMNNARGETVAEKPSFRAAFKRRRCLVPMAGFYEWKTTPAGKIPHYFSMLNAEQFAVAGIWERWKGSDSTEIDSFAIITTEANAIMAPVHDRMPAILLSEGIDAWLDPKNVDGADLQQLLVPYPADEMHERVVSTRVNSARNEGAELLA